MKLHTTVAPILALTSFAAAQTATVRVLSILSPQINAQPTLTPTIHDKTAPNPQDCPGYKASSVASTSSGFTADLNIAGPNCQAFGNDITNLVLEVNYQAKERLNIRIYPKYIAPANSSWFILPANIVDRPQWDGKTTANSSDLMFDWSNDPSFQFKISRTSTGEELFSTYGHVIVYEDQFLELATNMVEDYNVYGLAENIRDFRHGNNHTQTFYAVDAGNSVDGNAYGTIPFYQETRYGSNGSSTTAHGVYARNAHGQEWLLRENNITYRTLGGSFDLYFLSGQDCEGSSSALTTISQFHLGCIGTTAMQQYWTFGFHQARWGYENISVVQGVVDGYRAANIPMECLWNDLDIYDLYRDFTNNNATYPLPAFTNFIENLHANGQHYVPIIDSNIYVPNPDNESDSYAPYERGNELQTFIRDPTTGGYYFGDGWPGYSVWGDWLVSTTQRWWTNEIVMWHNGTPFDGIWIDLSEASQYCAGSCGNGRLDEDPIHPPFLLPGDPLDFDFAYPEAFNITNATEAASATAAASSQVSALSASPPLPVASMTSQGRTQPTPGVRNLNYPPYVINNVRDDLGNGSIAPNATHNDQYNTTEYEMHNLFGLQISNATYYALLEVFPGKRPFTVGRSVFAGSGKTTAHWGGDNTSKWGSMFLSISQALTMMMSGIQMFGADTCGFAHNTDYQLCSRWMELSAFFPFYRNHNDKATIGQEAYRWSSVSEAARRAISVRYSLLTYMYTLFYYAHTEGQTVMRALAWEFPEDESLRATYAQFLLGPSILVTPVLAPNVETVQGVFPGIGEGTRWYDWYTLAEVQAKPQENVTMDAPLEHINVHVRGGSILALQQPKYTTTETRNTAYSLLVALDDDSQATGSLYLDDGVSLEPNATRLVHFAFVDNCLSYTSEGSYHAAQPLANITITGLQAASNSTQSRERGNGPLGTPQNVSCTYGHADQDSSQFQVSYDNGLLKVSGTEAVTQGGAFEQVMKLCFRW